MHSFDQSIPIYMSSSSIARATLLFHIFCLNYSQQLGDSPCSCYMLIYILNSRDVPLVGLIVYLESYVFGARVGSLYSVCLARSSHILAQLGLVFMSSESFLRMPGTSIPCGQILAQEPHIIHASGRSSSASASM